MVAGREIRHNKIRKERRVVGVVRHSHTHSKSTHTQLVQGKEEKSEWGVYVESSTTARTVAVSVSSKSSTSVVSLNEKARGGS